MSCSCRSIEVQAIGEVLPDISVKVKAVPVVAVAVWYQQARGLVSVKQHIATGSSKPLSSPRHVV